MLDAVAELITIHILLPAFYSYALLRRMHKKFAMKRSLETFKCLTGTYF